MKYIGDCSGYNEYRGVKYWNVYYYITNEDYYELIDYNKKFKNGDDMFKYIDKVIMRKKKLERLKLI